MLGKRGEEERQLTPRKGRQGIERRKRERKFFFGGGALVMPEHGNFRKLCKNTPAK